MQIFPTKPPPSAARSADLPAKPSIITGYRQLDLYKLPMAGDHLPAWKKLLRDAGYPDTVVVLDFESYFDSEYRMGKCDDCLSTIEYIMDKRFEVVGLGHLLVSDSFPNHIDDTYFTIGGPAVETYIRWLQSQYGPSLKECTVVAQNARFDLAILARKYGIYPKFTIDLLGLARHWKARALNDLASLTKRFGLPPKGDTSEFEGVTLRQRWMRGKGKVHKMPTQRPMATDDQLNAIAKYGSNDVMREWELFTLLLPKLSNPIIELALMQHTLELFTRPSISVDQERGRELIAGMEAEIDRAVGGITNHTGQPATRKDVKGTISFEKMLLAALTRAGDDPKKYFKYGKKGPILAIAKDDDERDLLLKHADPQVRGLMGARVALKSWPLHINRVERILKQAKVNGGLLPVPLGYHGAHTGRYTGGEKINLQNMPVRGDKPLVLGMRTLLVAPPGKTLVIVDEAQIEARITPWIAGQADMLAKWEKNEDLYCDFASKVVGYRVRKPRKTDGIAAIEQRMGWARNSIGKVGVLGCGYGMGPAKAVDYANGTIDFATAEKIVQTYRQENPQIVKFWKDIEAAFRYTFKYRRPTTLSHLRLDSQDDCDVIITLPNGRELKYHAVKFGPGIYGEVLEIYNEMEHKWEHTWGGSLTENIVQAMARDTLVEAMLRTEDRGIHTALSVHDELIAVVPYKDAELALAVLVKELSRRPEWAPGLPLSAEGTINERYGSH